MIITIQAIEERRDDHLLVLPTDAVLFEDSSFKVSEGFSCCKKLNMSVFSLDQVSWWLFILGDLCYKICQGSGHIFRGLRWSSCQIEQSWGKVWPAKGKWNQGTFHCVLRSCNVLLIEMSAGYLTRVVVPWWMEVTEQEGSCFFALARKSYWSWMIAPQIGFTD